MPKRAYPPEGSTLPASRASGPCVPPTPEAQGPEAESRAWVCLILLIRLNFSFASFSPGPCRSAGVPGWGKDRFMQLFSYIPSSERGGGGALHPPLPIHPTRLPCGVSVCMFPSLWWEIV